MDDLLSIFQDFDVTNFLPEPDRYVSSLACWTRFFVLLPPVIVLLLGLLYYFKPTPEANRKAGFRCIYSMGSVEAWQYSQRVAGLFYMIVGGGLSVIMLIVSLFFNGEKAIGMLTTALVCVVIEVLVVVALHAFLITFIGRSFDKDGNRKQ